MRHRPIGKSHNTLGVLEDKQDEKCAELNSDTKQQVLTYVCFNIRLDTEVQLAVS